MRLRVVDIFRASAEELPEEFESNRVVEVVDRAVCDYIAGMTDPFAVEQFQKLFIPKGWTVK